MKVIIEKHLLDQVLEICKILENAEPVESNWLDNVPEKHRKFAAYWNELGRPELEFENTPWHHWCKTKNPDWEADNYRIKNDPHWQLRLKWVNSDKTLPIEIYDDGLSKNWHKIGHPLWYKDSQYREAKPWYEQEISEENPIMLRWHKMNMVGLWIKRPVNCDEFEPLTDQEIDALKRGF